jgi:hypothetical protein
MIGECEEYILLVGHEFGDRYEEPHSALDLHLRLHEGEIALAHNLLNAVEVVLL